MSTNVPTTRYPFIYLYYCNFFTFEGKIVAEGGFYETIIINK